MSEVVSELDAMLAKTKIRELTEWDKTVNGKLQSKKMTLWEKLWFVKHHQIEMLMDRNVPKNLIPDIEIFNFTTVDEFRDHYLSQFGEEEGHNDAYVFSLMSTLINNPRDRVLVWYFPTQNTDVPVSDITDFFAYYQAKNLHTENYKHVIFISDKKINSSGLTRLSTLKDLTMEFFLYNELMFNPQKHILVPPMSVITHAEYMEMFKLTKVTTGKRTGYTMAINKADLPQVSEHDPQIKWLNLPRGTVVRFLRQDRDGSHTLYYRIVVARPIA